MADKNTRRATQHDLQVPRPDRIRNVVLVGPTGSGKTSLVEALLLATGAITRAGSVTDGTTVSDFEEPERAHQRSVSLAVTPLVHRDTKVNLLDTPGYADFGGEVRAGLRAADAALFVIGANTTVDEATWHLWRECTEVDMPRAVVVTKLDHARADHDAAVASVRDAFGEKAMSVLVPVLAGGTATSVDHLLDPATSDARRDALIEAIIEESEDEGLMDRYLAGEEVGEDTLLADLEKAMATGRFHPVLPVCATTGVGCVELLDLVVAGFPPPDEHPSPEVFLPTGKAAPPLTCDPAGPLVAEVVKTSSDPYVGRVSIVRVFSGTLRPDLALHVSGHVSSFFGGDSGHEDHDADERSGVLSYPFGQHLVTAPSLVAGDIGCVSRLATAETGDTLSSPEDPRVLKPWSVPDPQLPVAIEAATRSDEDRLSSALTRLAAEDPSLRVERNAETQQVVLWVLGEAHTEVALDRLSRRHGVNVVTRDLVVPLRETFTSAGKGHGRHVKQSGGHGQYAVVVIEGEPGPAGSGIVFEQRIVGGTVPSQFHGSVEKGIRTQAQRGVSGDRPIVDVRVTLVDGKAHSVDSSDAAFQAAGALALRELVAAASTRILEPWCEIAVTVPGEYVGAVMSDLSGRRARVTGSDADPDRDRTTVRAEIPEVELLGYPGVLRSVTHGTGSFTRRPTGYEPAPASVAVPA